MNKKTFLVLFLMIIAYPKTNLTKTGFFKKITKKVQQAPIVQQGVASIQSAVTQAKSSPIAQTTTRSQKKMQ